MNVLLGIAAIALLVYGARSLDRFEAELAVEDEDWAPPMFRGPVLDRAELLELPFSPLVSDEDALAALAEIRGLPEFRARAGA